jgi:hypothetical protein
LVLYQLIVLKTLPLVSVTRPNERKAVADDKGRTNVLDGPGEWEAALAHRNKLLT